MKGMDIFCASPASTAICSSLDHRSMVRHGAKPLDRSNSKPYIPCTSSTQLPFNPMSLYEKTRKSFSKESDAYRKSSADVRESVSIKKRDFRRKSSADASDLHCPSSSRYLLSDRPYLDWISESDQCASTLVPINQTTKPRHKTELVNGPPGRKSSSLGWVSESDQVSTLVSKPRVSKVRDTRSTEHVPARKSSSLVSSQEWTSKTGYGSSLVPTTQNYSRPRRVNATDSPDLKSSSSDRSLNQVVVLRVSIHCKGCEGKVRKHISKMEGVTSFTIDLATKKVTVIGDVTPLGVLASISKVKNAQLWPSSTTTSSSYDPSPRWSS